MWEFEYKSQTGIFSFEDNETRFSFTLHFEDGMSCEVIRNNPVAFFFSKRKDSTNQVKTVMTINIQTYEMDISVRLGDDNYRKINLSLPIDTAKSIFNIANMYQHMDYVPEFSFKKVVRE